MVKTDDSANVVTWDGATNDQSGAQFVSEWAAATFIWDGAVWLVSVNVSRAGTGDSAPILSPIGPGPVSVLPVCTDSEFPRTHRYQRVDRQRGNRQRR